VRYRLEIGFMNDTRLGKPSSSKDDARHGHQQNEKGDRAESPRTRERRSYDEGEGLNLLGDEWP
jgi:hypothetical protein